MVTPKPLRALLRSAPLAPLALGVFASLVAPQAGAQTVISVADLQFTGIEPNIESSYWLDGAFGPTVIPRVVVAGQSAVLQVPRIKGTIHFGLMARAHVAIELEQPAGDLEGVLYLPDEAGRRLIAHPFVARDGDQRVDAELYRTSLAAHYAAHAGADLPGGPYFRRRHRALGIERAPESTWPIGRSARGDDTFAMFTGGRALAENLRLDEVISEAGDNVELIDLNTIAGVDVPAMQWEELVAGIDPALDSLSFAIPEDQHAVFFPSFQSLLRVADQLSEDAAPLVHLFDQRAVKQLVRERYERQLCLRLDGLTRQLGGAMIKSAALTGSDPYLRTGSDLALLFEGNVETISAFMRARFEAASEKASVELVESKAAGWPTFSVQTDDRRVSAWLVATDTFVVVANSEAQLTRVLAANDKSIASLGESDEYRWFRDRYPLTKGTTEDALLVVTDAAIRRWSGPKWRIATARRTKALSVLSDADAWRIADIAQVEAGPAPLEASPVLGGGKVTIERRGALDDVYGTRAFLTPIAELAMAQVTKSEEAGYLRWRRSFEASWGGAFDPLAVRIDVREDGVDVDLTLIPLIVRTQYRYLIELAGSSTLGKDVPGAHPEALAYWVSAIDHDEPSFTGIKGLLRNLSLGDDSLGWVGNHIAVWFDEDDEYFERAKDVDSADMFLEEMLPGLPIGVRIDTKNPLLAAAFLTSVRGLLEDAVPGMFEFESRDYGGRKYVAVVSDEGLGFGEVPTLYYVATARGLVLSFSEHVIERAIDRAGADIIANDWQDRGVSLTVKGETRKLVGIEAFNVAAEEQLRAKSWTNLPILNEWVRKGESDPVAFHELEWGTRLVCPGGGAYVWNEEHQTMESTAYGHPADPREGPSLPPAVGSLELMDFGLAFESFRMTRPEDRAGERRGRWLNELRGLRAQIRLRRH